MSLPESLALTFTPAVRIVAPLYFVGLALLWSFRPASRRRLTADALAGLGALGGLLLAAFLRSASVPPTSIRLVGSLSFLVLSLGAINASGILVFDAALPALRIELPALARDLILAAGYAAAGLAVLSGAGVNLADIIATSAVVTAIIAFSLQDTLGNVMGGMVLQFEHLFEPGDILKLASGETGVVRQIRWRQTTIETFDGSLIVVPNSSLMKGVYTVVGRRFPGARRIRRTIAFSADYEQAPTAVIEAVDGALRRDPPAFVAAEPRPYCLVNELGPDAASYAVRYWLTNVTEDLTTDSAVRTRIHSALARAGISLAVPSRGMVRLQSDQSMRERGRIAEHQRRLAALKGDELFRSLTEEELSTLADRLKSAPFSKGEAVILQGHTAHWLYILAEGQADVLLRSEESGETRKVASLGPGSYVGEMGLLTGEPRSATVLAATDVFCYRLDHESFTDIITRRPEIAEGISKVLAARRVELEAAREGLNEEARTRRLERTQDDILSRIRRFFTIN